MKKEKVIVAIHGILTGETSRAWQERFRHFVAVRCAGITVLNREYWAGPFPVWNVFVANRFFAAALADLVSPYAADGADISFFSHSNGADVAVKTIRSLAHQGIATRALVCAGAAIQADIVRNGIEPLLDCGKLGRAVAYCSKGDTALLLKAIWPYGHLGRQGFMCDGAPVASTRLRTIWYPGYGHSTYFDADHEEQTFERAVADCCYL